MLILGIESSCDETGVALYSTQEGLLADALHSQVDMHAAYGGVVPELASRDHIRRLLPLIDKALADSGRSLQEVDLIAVTQGPGLGGALLAGASVAAALGAALDKPVVGIHHLEGHLLSPLLSAEGPAFPFVALLVSGGHTQLMHVTGIGRYVLLGETIDDAAGEAFDKTASLLDLGYPGGPALAALAAQGNAARYALPRPLRRSGVLDFSFSGLKTAVAMQIRQCRTAGQWMPEDRADMAASFQEAVVDLLVEKSLSAMQQTECRDLVVAGGVGANHRLRARLDAAVMAQGARVRYPPLRLCTDNGAMIALAAAMRHTEGVPLSIFEQGSFSVKPRWPLQTPMPD